MEGKPITFAKEALKLFILSLPEESYFNVFSFGNYFEKLFSYPKIYSQENLDFALEKIEQFEADMGGTEIFEVL